LNPGGISSKKNLKEGDLDQQARNTGGFGSAGGWAKNSVDDGGAFRSSLRSLNNNSSKMITMHPFAHKDNIGGFSIQSS
jgi:hypothetical protein